MENVEPCPPSENALMESEGGVQEDVHFIRTQGLSDVSFLAGLIRKMLDAAHIHGNQGHS